MPLYDYKCIVHGYFEKRQKVEYHASGNCPVCGTASGQVQVRPPSLDIEAMADIGMPGAIETSGDRMTKRHFDADRAGDWASRDSIEFQDSAGEDRKGDFMKAVAAKAAETE